MELALAGCVFELIENKSGRAAEKTLMVFGSDSQICTATYTGPNVKLGQVMVSGDRMMYHAIDGDGELAAGQAKITLQQSENENTIMKLSWNWLSGDQAGGESFWKLLDFTQIVDE